MNVCIDCCFFVLENVLNENKRKNDVKKIKLLVDKNNELPSIKFNGKKSLKDCLKEYMRNIVGSDTFHLEQVYTLGDERYSTIDVNTIYLGITNSENIKTLDDNYKLIDFDIIEKKKVLFGNESFEYETKLKKENNELEYYHEIKTKDINLEKKLIEVITSYKQIISKIDYTDIMFKFMPKYYTLEDVRMVYEKIKDLSTDKSNFRKRIIKYCKPTNKMTSNKGYRPTQLYEFIPDEGDIWV